MFHGIFLKKKNLSEKKWKRITVPEFIKKEQLKNFADSQVEIDSDKTQEMEAMSPSVVRSPSKLYAMKRDREIGFVQSELDFDDSKIFSKVNIEKEFTPLPVFPSPPTQKE